MSLYHDAASVLSTSTKQGSLKSRIYAKDANLKSKPAHVYALISETAKYDTFLTEVIDNAGILAHEAKLNPLLALLLVHDHFFSKSGIAAATSHPLRQSIERHKARLQSEFTKARLKRRIATVEQVKATILKEKGITGRTHPRWARINTLKSSQEAVIRRDFLDYQKAETIGEVVAAAKHAKILHYDEHVPSLLAFPPDIDLTKLQAYLNGDIILQDKASCFPAHLLVGTETQNSNIADVIDGCAAPGNKTTHLAALLRDSQKRIFACERDVTRSKVLQSMVDKAGGGGKVTVLHRQDFLALDPQDTRFQEVTHLLLDPSCSGSGILGREDIPDLTLPKHGSKTEQSKQSASRSKKRKREAAPQAQRGHDLDEEELDIGAADLETEQQPIQATKDRLEKLSNLQSRIVEHAFSFPAAKRVTYSTCSIHVEENEAVVARVLDSRTGKSRGWKVLKREEQVYGMRIWNQRGTTGGHELSDEQREACIRCTPNDGEGTMGFFVCAFVRDPLETSADLTDTELTKICTAADEWEGFSDA